MNYALVTGASSGIGFAYAQVLAQRGYNLIMVSNDAPALATSVETLRQAYPTLSIIPLDMDLGRAEAAEEVYRWTQQQGYIVDVLVNNAGVYHDRDFLDDTPAFTQLILQLHVTTPTLLMHYFASDMVKRGQGYVLNMSSVTSNFAAQRLSTYSSTKGYLRFLSRATYIELRQRGVHVTCVRPGAVATGLYNISPRAMRIGLMLGYIITPEQLARKALKALFAGRRELTPGLSTKLLDWSVRLLPTPLLCLIRRLRLF